MTREEQIATLKKRIADVEAAIAWPFQDATIQLTEEVAKDPHSYCNSAEGKEYKEKWLQRMKEMLDWTLDDRNYP